MDFFTTTDKDSAYRPADLVIIATPTNYDEKEGLFDTSAVEDAIGWTLKVNPKATILFKRSNMKKVCFIASSGGHWEELICLKVIAEEHDSFFITEEGGQIQDSKIENAYTVPQINRHEKGFVLHFLNLFKFAKKVLQEEKPNVVITTGALVAYPFCLIAKFMKIKVIYIESFARVNNASLTGKLVYPFADLFLVQWEPLLKVYPKAVYVGGIF